MPTMHALQEALLSLGMTAFAQEGLGGGLQVAEKIGLRGGLVELIAGIIKLSLGLVGVLALAFLVYGGFLYITSRGDKDQVGQAKQTITYALLGILVVGLAYAAVAFVLNFFIQGGGGGGGGGGGIDQ